MSHVPSKTRSLKSIGFLLLGASLLCGVIAFEKHRSAVVTTQAFSEAISVEGVDFQTSIPPETYVAGFLCVLLGTASAQCLWKWRLARSADSADTAPMLP